MKRECRQINYNWRQVGPLQADEGFEFDSFTVGMGGVVSIVNMTPTEDYCGPEFYDINFNDGRIVTVYNVNEAFLFPVEG